MTMTISRRTTLGVAAILYEPRTIENLPRPPLAGAHVFAETTEDTIEAVAPGDYSPKHKLLDKWL